MCTEGSIQTDFEMEHRDEHSDVSHGAGCLGVQCESRITPWKDIT